MTSPISPAPGSVSIVPATVLASDRGFDAFAAGSMGNGGQNLYVSRAGTLQRIFLTDVTGDGYVDIPIANSHDDDSRVPAYVFDDPLGSSVRAELPTDGAFAAAAGDLTGDGYDDLVIANQYDGCSNEVFAQVYYGSSNGFDRRRMTQLWAPSSRDVTIGSFSPWVRPSIAFVSRERVRIFDQIAGGFEAQRYTDLELGAPVDSLVSADLDGDGVDDLIVRFMDGRVIVLWGGDGGLHSDRRTDLDGSLTGVDSHAGAAPAEFDAAAAGGGASGLTVYKLPKGHRLKVVEFEGSKTLFLPLDSLTTLVRFTDRIPNQALRLETGPAVSVATADLRGLGRTDLVVAVREPWGATAESSIYWGAADGAFSDAYRTALPTVSANDVVVGRFGAEAIPTVVVSQDATAERYTTESLLFSDLDPERTPRRTALESHAAVDALVLRAPDAPERLALVNHLSNTVKGDIDTTIFLGGPNGYSADRHLALRGWAAVECKFVDLTDNGRPDIVLANSNENDLDVDHGCFVFYTEGDGGPAEGRRVELDTRYTMSTVIGDLDRNGYLDLVVSGFDSSTVKIFPGGPDGFGAPRALSIDLPGRPMTEPRFMSLADLDNDGWLDLVIPECGPQGGVLILHGGPEGFDIARSTVLECGPTISSRVADLDGDGWPDLIVGSYQGPDRGDKYRGFVFVYWGGPDGYSASRRTQLPAYFPGDLAIADFNGDGLLDIFVANYHGHRTRDIDSYIYWAEPGGVFRPEHRQALPHHSATAAFAVDLDGDGAIDLVVANHKTYGNHVGESWIWWNRDGGFDVRNRQSLPSRGPHGITHMDVGNIMDRSPEEIFTSRPIEFEAARVSGLRWEGTEPPKSWVRAEMRTASAPDLLDAAVWLPCSTVEEERVLMLARTTEVARVAQYRLHLGSTSGVSTPRVTAVQLLGETAEDA